MKNTRRILTIMLLNSGLAGCLPSTGYRADNVIHYPEGQYTGIPGENYSPATEADEMGDESDAEEVQGGINVGGGAGNSPTTDDIEPITMPISGVGYYEAGTGPSVEVEANKILKVKFSPNPQNSTVEGTGFSPTYGGLGVYIQVGNLSQATPLLSSGVIATPQASQVMNFSSKIPQTCGNDPECRVTVRIRVNRPNYDFYCLNFPGGFMNGDSWHHPCNYPGYTKVHENHPWNGTLYIYTDDTGAPSS